MVPSYICYHQSHHCNRVVILNLYWIIPTLCLSMSLGKSPSHNQFDKLFGLTYQDQKTKLIS